MTPQTVPVKKASVTVVALAVVCVILAAGFVGLIALYAPSNSSSNADQQATIDHLNEQLANFLANQTDPTVYLQQIAQLRTQLQQYQSGDLTSANDTITALQQQITVDEQLLALQKTGTIYAQNTFTQNANAMTQLFAGSTSYAGYVAVQATSNSSSTFAQVQFTF
jgi:threonine dehydrogenase-like Zn-dependent dehydrogenase